MKPLVRTKNIKYKIKINKNFVNVGLLRERMVKATWREISLFTARESKKQSMVKKEDTMQFIFNFICYKVVLKDSKQFIFYFFRGIARDVPGSDHIYNNPGYYVEQKL